MDAHLSTLFFKASLVGLLIAAPVGPIGLLTIQRTLDRGLAVGLATGLGAAFADALYGALGAFGVTQVTAWLAGARTWLGLGGGAMLLWMAARTFVQPPAVHAAALPTRADLARCFAGTFLLTLSNPATILSFLAVFASMAGATMTTASAVPMVLGVLAGSAAWWVGLTLVVTRWRHRFDATWRRRINRLSALLLAAFALWQWARVLSV
ncbi:LysE family translocator [Variovorax ginsengisoli]|uniref:Threonine/homoserine/homoserine lactone efflux protein n=1 Tax=Variovorax ginsengisoli TaxID=363844 RepID=A0ABT9SB63_9BURK|nr:LysE family transporter [Variovorax ginsengisoli]MDP9901601.1 threonine/homoserine/homoserine lactone efflux protein [Variovorax ginsengisoli]